MHTIGAKDGDNQSEGGQYDLVILDGDKGQSLIGKRHDTRNDCDCDLRCGSLNIPIRKKRFQSVGDEEANACAD